MKQDILANKTILVAEDDNDLRDIIGDVLRMHGATVFEAENGTRALELYRSQTIDLVISDIRMPNGDGIQFLAGVRERDTDVPFLFLSGYSDLTVEDAERRGAQGLFTKPFDVFELVLVIAKSMSLPIG